MCAEPVRAALEPARLRLPRPIKRYLRIIVKDEAGHTFVQIPVTVAAVGAVLAPVVAAVGAIAAMAAKLTIVVEKSAPQDPPAAS